MSISSYVSARKSSVTRRAIGRDVGEARPVAELREVGGDREPGPPQRVAALAPDGDGRDLDASRPSRERSGPET